MGGVVAVLLTIHGGEETELPGSNESTSLTNPSWRYCTGGSICKNTHLANLNAVRVMKKKRALLVRVVTAALSCYWSVG